MKYNKLKENTIKRGIKKATYNKKEIHDILDAGEICFVAFNVDNKAFVQPINYGRSGDTLYMHGALQNRMTNTLIDSGEVCLSVMHLDAMKLTRSAFSHSVNYRSVVIFGKVQELITHEEKLAGLKSIINHFIANRWDYCRVPNKKELNATRVISISIESASAKIADGSPNDNKKDYDLDFWAGIIPVKTVYDFPVPDSTLKSGVEIPKHVLDFCKNKQKPS